MADNNNENVNLFRFFSKKLKSNGSVLMLLCIITIIFSLGNPSRMLNAPDEARYSEIPREMAVSGDFITPRLNGVKYFEKPPLFYWMQVIPVKLFGINNWSMRLWHTIFGVFGCFLVFLVANRLYSKKAGLYGAAVLSSMLLYFCMSKFVCLDLIFSVLLSGAIISFMLAEEKSWGLKSAGYIFIGLAFLTKGLVAIVLTGLVFGIWILYSKNWSFLKILYHPSILLFFAIVLPWHVLVAVKNPDFNYQYFIYEHFIRYTTTVHQRYQPWWFFILIGGAGLFPWAGMFLAEVSRVLKKFREADKYTIILTIWFVVPILFFSFSGSKLIPYILPSMIPASILVGRRLSRSLERKDFFNIFIIIDLIIGVGGFAYITKEAIQDYHPPELIYLILFGLSLILVGALPFFIKKAQTFVVSKFITIFCIFSFLSFVIAPIQENNKPSLRPLINAINGQKSSGDLIFCFGKYYQELPLYTENFVGLVGFFDELEFGARAEKVYDRFLSITDFLKLWEKSKSKIFLVTSLANYEYYWKKQKHFVLIRDKKNIVLTNQ